MPIDVDEQITKYFTWIEARVGFSLHPDEATRRHEPLPLPHRSEVPVGPPPSEPGRRGRVAVLMVAAAAVVAATVVVATRLDVDRTTDSPSPTAEVTAPPATAGPSTSLAPATTVPSSSTAVDPRDAIIAEAAASRACADGQSAESVGSRFADAMIAARSIDIAVPVGGCMEAVPDAFSATVPTCWEVCEGATRSFNRAALSVYEWFDANNTSHWSARLPVTYAIDGQFVDVVETWLIAPTASGFEIDDYRIEESFIERGTSIATIDAYLALIKSGDWMGAATLLDSGALSADERTDIQELAPATFTIEGIADALEQWCAAGCDTTPVDPAEVTFDGGYSVTRNGRTVVASWYEGVYSIVGAPFLER